MLPKTTSAIPPSAKTKGKTYNFKIEVINDSGITEMTMKFDKIDDNPKFNKDYFDLDSIISDAAT